MTYRNSPTHQTGPEAVWVDTIGPSSVTAGAGGGSAARIQDPSSLTGFTRIQLAHAFDRVRNARDWKAPIFARIATEDRRLVARAIYWYTATDPVFAAMPDDPSRLIVTAVGYRLGPVGHPCAR